MATPARRGQVRASRKPARVVYSQAQIAPDFAAPATRVRQKPVSWTADRRRHPRAGSRSSLTIDLATARLPSLAMFPAGSQQPIAVLDRNPETAVVAARDASSAQGAGPGRGQARPDRARLLRRLRLPLRGRGGPRVPHRSRPPRHRDGRGDRRIGARTIVAERIDDVPRGDDRAAELPSRPEGTYPTSAIGRRPGRSRWSCLRYGRMRLKKEWQQITVDDFQSQHELLIRMLVGRVDDDTGQAHDPATYVPVLFVDNPWSKALGREVQGFDKRLADFCILEERPAGRAASGRSARRTRPDAKPVPLTRITEVRLTGASGRARATSNSSSSTTRSTTRDRRRLRRDRPGPGPRHLLLRPDALAAERLRRHGVPAVVRPRRPFRRRCRDPLGPGLADRRAEAAKGLAVGDDLDNRNPRPRRWRPRRAAERNGRADALGGAVGAEPVEEALLAAGHSPRTRARGSAFPAEAGTACDARWTSTSTTASYDRALQRRRDRPGRSPAAASSPVRSADAISAIHPGLAG